MTPRDQFGLDALLGRWPAQDPQENGGIPWEQRADAIVKSAIALKGQASPEVLTALLEAPPLDAEPGEEKAGDFQFHEASPVRAETPGEKRTMSTSDAPKRPSLKELAARASVAGAGRASVTPLPPSIRSSAPPPSAPATVTPLPSSSGLRVAASAPSAPTPISKAAKAARASDPGREDSGVLRLADVSSNEAAKAEAAAAAAEADLAAAAAKRTEGQAAAAAPVIAKPAAEEKKSSTGMFAGVAIAVLGIAAAFAVYQSRTPTTTQAPTAASSPEMKPTPAPVASEAPKPATEPTAVASSEPAPAATTTPAADDAKGTAGGAPASTAAMVASNDSRPSPQASAKPGSKVGTLDEEMKKAVGGNDLPSAPQDDGSKPAAGGGGNVPEQPSQGNAQAAVRSVLPGAKACVAGAPEPTTASITFSSSGSATSVSVGGWAAANGKAGCVKSALMGARVSPFAKPSYTVPVTVRP